MPRSHVRPTYGAGGQPAYDFACECGTTSKPPVATPAEANRQREQHQRDAHNQ